MEKIKQYIKRDMVDESYSGADLANEISDLLIHVYGKDAINHVKIFDDIIDSDEVIKNFYECKTYKSAPLFALLEYSEIGQEELDKWYKEDGINPIEECNRRIDWE